MRSMGSVFILFGVLVTTTLASDEIRVSGRVIDEYGQSVPGATICPNWNANGRIVKSDTNPVDRGDRAQLMSLMANEGHMEPGSLRNANTTADGRFELKIRARTRALIAMNRQRTHGAIVEVPHDFNGELLCLQLLPLVTVRGVFVPEGSKKLIDFSHASLELFPNPDCPLGIRRVAGCGSFRQRFEFRMPRGTYQLTARASSNSAGRSMDMIAKSHRTVRLDDNTKGVVDLGEIVCADAPQSTQEKVAELRRNGRWKDITNLYGKPAPQWHATDVRGISKNSTADSYRGKWLLIQFWSLSCAPCLRNHIPKLQDFHEDHSHQSDKFKVIGLCIDPQCELKSIEDLEESMKPLIAGVWKGRDIRFPIVLDSSFESMERYGVRASGTVVLVNPQGILIPGGVETLEALLDEIH